MNSVYGSGHNPLRSSLLFLTRPYFRCLSLILMIFLRCVVTTICINWYNRIPQRKVVITPHRKFYGQWIQTQKLRTVPIIKPPLLNNQQILDTERWAFGSLPMPIGPSALLRIGWSSRSCCVLKNFSPPLLATNFCELSPYGWQILIHLIGHLRILK